MCTIFVAEIRHTSQRSTPSFVCPGNNIFSYSRLWIFQCREVRGCVGMLLLLIMSPTAGLVNGDLKISPVSQDVR